MGFRVLTTAAVLTGVVALPAASAASARAAHAVRAAHGSRGGALTGTWSGYISRQTSSGTTRQKIVIEVNAAETRGTWQLGPACHGKLTLQSISGGYHHYLRHVAAGGSCAGGDVDCLMPDAGEVYDSVTSHLGGAYDESGKLRRVRGSATRAKPVP